MTDYKAVLKKLVNYADAKLYRDWQDEFEDELTSAHLAILHHVRREIELEEEEVYAEAQARELADYERRKPLEIAATDSNDATWIVVDRSSGQVRYVASNLCLSQTEVATQIKPSPVAQSE